MGNRAERRGGISSEIAKGYGVFRNTFVRKVKGDKHNELEVEVGDIGSDEFKPHLRIKRWGDECSFSCELLDCAAGSPLLRTDKNKIKFGNNKTEAHFYDIPGTDEPDGSEFEVVLKEKPKINVVSMLIATKGLAFYYQPELTKEEIADGCIRPENVVGSYAVYHESKAGDYSRAGSKNYKSGKAFHIYRPKITDAKGKSVWGKLNIEGNLLTIEIPQRFLDKAKYPVSVDPEFGYTSLGASEYGYGGNKLYGSVYTSPVDIGEVTDMYVGGHSGTNLLKVSIVLESTLSFVANGITNGAAIGSPKNWGKLLFASNPTLSPSTDYLLAMIPKYNLVYFAYDSGPLYSAYYDASNSYATPTNPTDAVHLQTDYSSRKYSIYCTYVAIGGIPMFKVDHGLVNHGLVRGGLIS
ncbi:MAG: hypothetical protein JRI70_08485 [Deltaproteobacteria bacterium]|nr:hypothetical protein [Deltaproteobacteria bacterium]